MLLSIAVLLPWVAGVLLVGLDGRRRVVGMLAVTAAGATVAVLGVLLAQVLASGTQTVVTGNWPAGVGIVLRADPLAVTFGLLSVVVVLAATVHELIIGISERTFPGLVVLLAGALTGLFLTGDVFNFYVFFELAMTAS